MSCLALHPWRCGQPALELGHRHDRTGKGDRTDKHRDHNRDQCHDPGGIQRRWIKSRSQGHKQRRHAATTVEQGHHLRHGGHRYALSGDRTEHTTNGRTGNNPDPSLGIKAGCSEIVAEQSDHCQTHRHRSQLIGSTRRTHLGQPLDAEGQQQNRNQIDRVFQEIRHQRFSLRAGLRLNMASIRSVTRNPPITLNRAKPREIEPSTSSA